MPETRNQRLAALAAGLVAVVALLWIANIGPFAAASINERVSSSVGADAKCRKFAVGEQGTIYRCSYRSSVGIEGRCFAVEDGEVVTARVDGC
jgi:hypothetical protein